MPEHDLKTKVNVLCGRVDDHETRVRVLESRVTEHIAEDNEHHRTVMQSVADLKATQSETKKEIRGLWEEVGRLKVKMSFVVALGGLLGGAIASVITALVLKGLG